MAASTQALHAALGDAQSALAAPLMTIEEYQTTASIAVRGELEPRGLNPSTGVLRSLYQACMVLRRSVGIESSPTVTYR